MAASRGAPRCRGRLRRPALKAVVADVDPASVTLPWSVQRSLHNLFEVLHVDGSKLTGRPYVRLIVHAWPIERKVALARSSRRVQAQPMGGGLSSDPCYATVLLDEDLWRSLSAVDGAHEVMWVYGCALEHDHRSDHQALIYHIDGQSYWAQWSENGRPHISTTDQLRPPQVKPTPRRELPDQLLAPATPETTPADSLPAMAGERPGSPKPGSQVEALWAIAAALERLADVVAAALSSAGDTGRHAK
jgi:hypothetical protein